MPTVMPWRARLPQVEDIPDPVHDGDSIWLTTDQGDWYRKVRDCRLYQVFAPELEDPGGPECRQFVADWVARWNRPGLRWPFWVDTLINGNSRDMMTFGRFVSIVWNADRSSQLNAEVSAFVRANGYGGGTGA